MAIDRVPVALGARSYEVRIGPGLIDRAGAEIAPLLKRRRAAIVTDETVAPLHLARLQAALAAEGIDSTALALPAGEATKGWPEFARCVEWLLDQKIERRDIVGWPLQQDKQMRILFPRRIGALQPFEQLISGRERLSRQQARSQNSIRRRQDRS